MKPECAMPSDDEKGRERTFNRYTRLDENADLAAQKKLNYLLY